MSEPADLDLNEVLERARSRIDASDLLVEHTEEVQLHAPVEHLFREPLELTPAVEAILRRHLNPHPTRE